MDEEEADWDQLKKDLNDPVYVEKFISAALSIAIGDFDES